MNFQRILANAIARRIALLLVAALFAWIGLGDAKAQTLTAAYASCQAYVSDANSRCLGFVGGVGQPYTGSCTVTATNVQFNCHYNDGRVSNNRFRWSHTGCAVGLTWHDVLKQCVGACPAGSVRNAQGECVADCANRAEQTFSDSRGITNGSTTCHNGCTSTINSNGDGTYTRTTGEGMNCNAPGPTEHCDALQLAQGWTNSRAIAGICVPPSVACPDGQTKNPVTGSCNNDACPPGMKRNGEGQCEADKPFCAAGQVRSPEGGCLPGEGQCAAGEARSKEGVCRRDTDGDGTPDDVDPDDPSSFSGGDSCDVPPTCSGDAIMCGQARIQWRIECNTRKDSNVVGGACNAMPVCTRGCDNMEYQQLIQQWKASCALQKLVSGEGGAGGIGGDGVLDFLRNARASDTAAADAIASGSDGLEGVSESDIWAPEGGDGTGINPGMFGGGSPTYCALSSGWDLFGHSIDPGPAFWSLAGWIGWLIVASAYFWIALKLGD